MTRSHPQTQINLTYVHVSGDTLPGSDGGDLTGNMTTIPRVSAPGTAQTTVYDAWNRLVELRQGGTVIADYKYDGRGRRIFKSTTDESRDFYYSNAWQILEERVSGAADTQYVWGLRYVDELICRDYDSDSDGTLEQRMYALQDANFNLTCIVDTSGDPQERYIYSPYGVRSIFNAFFTSRSYSSYVWMIAHQGLMLDYESGLVYNRNRMLHPKLGRFLQRDPLGYVDAANLYQYVRGGPINRFDPSGEQEPVWADRCRLCGGYHMFRPCPKANPQEPSSSSCGGSGGSSSSDSGSRADGGAGVLHQACSAWANGASLSAILNASPFGETGSDATAFGNEWQKKKGGDWGNAARHAYWQAMLACKYGEKAATAIGNAHECGQEGTVDSRVDQFNNAVARQIGIAVGKPCDEAKIRKAVEEALLQGKFITDETNDPRIPPVPKR